MSFICMDLGFFGWLCVSLDFWGYSFGLVGWSGVCFFVCLVGFLFG